MIDKITFAVGPIEPMVAFYSRVLGVELGEREMFGHTLYGGRFGEVELLFCPRELAGVRADINTVQLRFVVPDVPAAFERGVAAGGKALTAPEETPDGLLASLRDPDGNSLELKQAM